MPASPATATHPIGAPTSAVELLAVAFAALATAEQDEALSRLSELRFRHEASEESETARMVRALRRVADLLGEVPATATYEQWRPAETSEESETTTARRSEGRFRSGRLGKVWRYTDETLNEALACCSAYYGRVPQVAEYERWRQRELELAQAEGHHAPHLPSSSPYRRRWGSWERALVALGCTPAAIAGSRAALGRRS